MQNQSQRDFDFALEENRKSIVPCDTTARHT